MKRPAAAPPALTEPLRPTSPTPSRTTTMVALAVGTLAWWALWHFQDPRTAHNLGWWLGRGRWAILLLLTAVVAPPPVARLVGRGLDKVADPSSRARAWTAVGIAVAATAYLILTAHLQGRDLFPKTHDDQSYLLQMRMLAGGRLWMPPHPLADFFDTFYVLVRPVYASLYFPGASLMYAPTIWLGLPTWALPACVAGACVGLTYRVVAEAAGGAAGLLAAAGMVASEVFRVFSVLLTGHEPMLLLGLATVWAWLRWRAAAGPRRRAGWAFAVGAFAGWAAITRPADAVCWAAPVGLVILLDILRPRRRPAGEAGGASGASETVTVRPRWRRVAATAGLIVTGAAPFLAVQLAFNRGVTGRWTQSPYTYYLRLDQPNTDYGFHPYDPAARPASPLKQKQDHYAQFYGTYVLRHQPDQFLSWWGRMYAQMVAAASFPTRAAVPLAAAGLLAVGADRRRLALVAVLPVFFGVYVLNSFFLEHYALVAVPPLLMLVGLGIDRLAQAGGPRWGPSVRSGLTVGWLAACLLVLPEFNPLWADAHGSGDETFVSSYMRAVKLDVRSAADLRRPAVLLITYRTGDDVNEEAVYNTDTAWPDDAPIVYAHDLGPERNREIFRYYAERQPGRFFYRWDRRTGRVEDLGYARDLGR